MPLYSQIASAALREYDIPEHCIKHLGDAENVTYCVRFKHACGNEAGKLEEADDSAYDPHKLLLRIHRPQGHVRARMWNQPRVIHSELGWLKEISRRTPALVPLPVTSRSESEVVTVVLKGVEYACTLMRWVRGRSPTAAPGRNTAFSAGVATAWAHEASQQWIGHQVSRAMFERPEFEEFDFEFQGHHARLRLLELSPNLVRPVYDLAMLCDWQKLILSPAISHGMPKELSGRILAALGRADALLRDMPITHSSFGFVHADLSPRNYVTYRNSLRLIDFSCCGFGWYLQDIAVACSYLTEDSRQAFLLGYQSIRQLSEHDLNQLQAFVAIARVSLLLECWSDRCINTPIEF